MKKMIFIGIYGLLIMGAAAGGTWFLRQRDIDAQQELEAQHTEVTPLEQRIDVTQPLPPEESEDLPVAVRPGEMSIEEIVRYGLGLKSRESAIREREEALRRTENQHRLVLADIEGEQKEIEGLLAQARDQRLASEELLKEVQKKKVESEQLQKEVEAQKLKLENARQQSTSAAAPGAVETRVDREKNAKELVGVLESVSPAVAAGILKDFANDGQIDTAVELLSKLEERRAAAILDAMQDEKLISELVSKFMDMRRPVKL